MKSLTAILTRFTHFALYALLVLAPLLVLPLTRNLIVDTKSLLIFLILIIVLISFAIKTLVERHWEIAVSPFTFPLIVFGLAVLLSTLFTNKYPVEAMLGMGGLYLAMVLITIFGSSLIKGDHTRTVIRIMGVTGALLSISMLLQQLGWGPTRLLNVASAFSLPHTLLFNLSGSSFVAIQVIVLALVGLIGWSMMRKNWAMPEIILGLTNLAGLGLGLWSVFPGNVATVTITPFSASWTVMLRSLESWQTALIGHGPAAYANAYARFKPLWTNGQAYWQFNFGTATDTPLTLIVTLGLIGLLAWVFLVFQAFKQLKSTNKDSRPLLWILLASFIIQILAPTNAVVLALQIPLLIFWIAANQSHFSLLQFKTVRLQSYPTKLEFIKRFASKGNWFVRVTAVVLLLAAIGLTYALGRAYASFHYMYRANQALASQDAVQVYENQRRAVTVNPYLDSLRRDYALTNLQIAIALSNNTDITEEEQQQAVQLISQAVREGRAATLLDPNDVDNWLALAEIYRNLIGAANEADSWATNSLANAVQVNPINPLTRLRIGQLALNSGNAQDAARFFSQAVELKPDLPAAYYQLGMSFQALDQLENSRAAWQRALELLPTNADDYLTLSQQLEELDTIIQTRGEQVDSEETTETTPNVTEQNVQQQEGDVVNPGEDASLAQ